MVRGWDRLGGCSVQTTAARYLANLHGVHIIYSQGSTLLYLFLSLLPGSVAAAVLNCFSRVQVNFSNSRPNPVKDIILHCHPLSSFVSLSELLTLVGLAVEVGHVVEEDLGGDGDLLLAALHVPVRQRHLACTVHGLDRARGCMVCTHQPPSPCPPGNNKTPRSISSRER